MSEKPQPPPPIICVNDRLLLEYAILDESVGFREGHHILWVGTKEVGRVPCLAISQDKESPQVTFYCCDLEWNPVAIAAMNSVEEAKNKAERIYPGSSARWIQAHFTDEDVSHYLDEAFADLRCSFCGRAPDETTASIFQGAGATRICGDCVARFSRELERTDSDRDS